MIRLSKASKAFISSLSEVSTLSLAKLPANSVSQALNSMANSRWVHKETEKCICCQMAFGNFHEAFSFMAALAPVAEEMGHHPDWYNVYNRLEIKLSTHDAGDVTAKDIALAAAFDFYAQEFKEKSINRFSFNEKVDEKALIASVSSVLGKI